MSARSVPSKGCETDPMPLSLLLLASGAPGLVDNVMLVSLHHLPSVYLCPDVPLFIRTPVVLGEGPP